MIKVLPKFMGYTIVTCALLLAVGFLGIAYAQSPYQPPQSARIGQPLKPTNNIQPAHQSIQLAQNMQPAPPMQLVQPMQPVPAIPPGGAPVVTLRGWSASSEQEQYAFLAGVVSIFELEKEWQGQRGLLPLNQSMIASWGMGMDGMRITNIRDALNNYIINNPSHGDRLVLEVMWREFVQPKLQETTSVGGVDNTRQRVRKVMRSQTGQNPPALY